MKDLLLFLFMAVLLTPAFPSGGSKQQVPFVTRTETIRADIAIVDVPDRLLILKSADGTFYNFKMQPTTSIEVGGAKAKLEDLASQTGKAASVTFRVLRTGNIALKVEVQWRVVWRLLALARLASACPGSRGGGAGHARTLAKGLYVPTEDGYVDRFIPAANGHYDGKVHRAVMTIGWN
jgi:hypothetical protein